MSRLPSLEAEFKGTVLMKALALPPNIKAHLSSKAIPSNGSTYHLSTRWSTKLMRWWQGRRLVTLCLLHSQGKSGSAPWPGAHSQARLSLSLPPSDKLGMSTPLLWKIAWCTAENKTQYIQCFLAFPVSPEGQSSPPMIANSLISVWAILKHKKQHQITFCPLFLLIGVPN